jgi:hypothetical protein
MEASPAVAVARAIGIRDSQGRERAGCVTLTIIPNSKERRPWPSFGLREDVRQYIEARMSASVAAAQQLYITGPDYRPVDVETTVVPLDSADAGEVEKAVRATLDRFLHPLLGGPEGRGWQPNRDVFLSDIAALLERTEGVDFVRESTLSLDGVPQGERVRVPLGKTVVAGEFRIKLAL